MQCPTCKKNGFVVISKRRYCSNCGAKLTDQGGPRAMSDIKPNRPGASPAAPTTPATPMPSTDIPVPPSNTVAESPVKPAAQFHSSQVGPQPAVLDLRSANVASVRPESSAAATPEPEPAVASHPLIDKPHDILGIPAPSAPNPVAQPYTPAPEPKVTAAIAKPAPAVVLPSTSPAATMPAVAAPAAAPNPNIARFQPHPAVAQPTPSPLPEPVATQVDAMNTMAPQPDTSSGPTSDTLREVLATAKAKKAPSITKIGAALAVITLMGGLVWLQNSPKLAFHSAAAQAGIEASLPTYIPSSYQQTGPAQVGSGQLTLAFTSPSADGKLAITQKRTDWDSNSLRENYVSHQTDNFLAVQGQGLTIFLDNNEANWVNHGIWYSVNGTAKLSREQILKIAYGL